MNFILCFLFTILIVISCNQQHQAENKPFILRLMYMLIILILNAYTLKTMAKLFQSAVRVFLYSKPTRK